MSNQSRPCPNCGESVPAGAVNCPRCGQLIYGTEDLADVSPTDWVNQTLSAEERRKVKEKYEAERTMRLKTAEERAKKSIGKRSSRNTSTWAIIGAVIGFVLAIAYGTLDPKGWAMNCLSVTFLLMVFGALAGLVYAYASRDTSSISNALEQEKKNINEEIDAKIAWLER